jgi:hypothetical protein
MHKMLRYLRNRDFKTFENHATYISGVPVLVYDNHLEFHGTIIEDKIPDGAFYPEVDKHSVRFILTRFSPKTKVIPSSRLNSTSWWI